MEEIAPSLNNPTKNSLPWDAIGLLLWIATLLIAGAFIAYKEVGLQQAAPKTDAIETISPEELDERYGLRIHLIGVTAGGGMIDFRMKVTDPQKAKSFLEDPDNLPIITVAGSGQELMSPEGLDEEIEWLDGGILFNFYPNDGGLIQSGTAVIVKFGNVRLAPMPAE